MLLSSLLIVNTQTLSKLLDTQDVKLVGSLCECAACGTKALFTRRIF